MRKSFISAAVIALFAVSGAASAATYNVGNLTALGDDGYNTSITFAAGSINDTFTFDITGGSNTFTGLASKLSLKLNQLITNGAGTLTGPSFSAPLFASEILNPGQYFQALSYAGTLAQGTYSLNLTGTAAKGGTYNVNLLAAPVPEPETYAMLLAGLGLMGAVARRRSKTAA